MSKSVILIIFLYINLGNTAEQNLDELCYRMDQELPDLDSELENILIPSSYFNMVEQFTSLEDIVVKRAGEKIVMEDTNVTTAEFFRLGVFRRSNYFYLFIAFFYLYWLLYGFCQFQTSRKDFDKFIGKHRGFYKKSILLIIYAVFMFLTVYNSFYILEWIGYYENRYHGRAERFEKFLMEYEEMINSTSLRSSCSMEEVVTEIDEIEDFHWRIRRHYFQNVPLFEYTKNTISAALEDIRNNCRNETEVICGHSPEDNKIKNWTVIQHLKDTFNISNLENWDGLTKKFEAFMIETLSQDRYNFSDIQEDSRQRLMLLKDVYRKVEALFSMPGPLIIKVSFWFLHLAHIGIVFFSTISFLAMLRDHNYLENNGVVDPLVKFIKMLNYFIFLFAILALFWSWVVVLFSSAAHSLYLVVLRDTDYEVLGNLNIVDSNGSAHFNFGDFLKSTDRTVIERLLSLDPREKLRNNTESIDQFNEWKEKLEKMLEMNANLYTPPIMDFCENITQLLSENSGSWIDRLKQNLTQITRFCKFAENGCVFCKLKEELEKTGTVARKIREWNVAIPNRGGNDLQGLQALHQKYRLQMWNDYVTPITFLEVPSICVLICFYVLNTMTIVAISIVETSDPTPKPKNRFQYYKQHKTDRGLYWFNT